MVQEHAVVPSDDALIVVDHEVMVEDRAVMVWDHEVVIENHAVMVSGDEVLLGNHAVLVQTNEDMIENHAAMVVNDGGRHREPRGHGPSARGLGLGAYRRLWCPMPASHASSLGVQMISIDNGSHMADFRKSQLLR